MWNLLWKNIMNGCKILIVDDNTIVNSVYQNLFEGMGACVDTVTNLNQAQALIRNNVYDLVLSDLRLNGTDSREGLDVVRMARDTFPDAQIIIVTAEDVCEIREKAIRMGANHLFEKPVCPMDILKHIQNAIRDTVPSM